MKTLSALAVILLLALGTSSCTKKEMSMKDFFQIQNQYLDSDLSETSKEEIAKQYGFTAAQYNAFDEKVNSDPKLKSQLGEMRLKSQNK